MDTATAAAAMTVRSEGLASSGGRRCGRVSYVKAAWATRHHQVRVRTGRSMCVCVTHRSGRLPRGAALLAAKRQTGAAEGEGRRGGARERTIGANGGDSGGNVNSATAALVNRRRVK